MFLQKQTDRKAARIRQQRLRMFWTMQQLQKEDKCRLHLQKVNCCAQN